MLRLSVRLLMEAAGGFEHRLPNNDAGGGDGAEDVAKSLWLERGQMAKAARKTKNKENVAKQLGLGWNHTPKPWGVDSCQ